MNEERKSALRNIYKCGRGYMKDLREMIDNDSLLDEFISVGFIICGYTRTSKTWRLSSLGRSYVENLKLV